MKSTVHLIKRSGTYRARYKGPDGKRHEFSTGARNKTEAREIVDKAGLDHIVQAANAGRLTRQLFRTITTGQRKPEKLEDLIQQWTKWMSSIGRSRATVETNQTHVLAWARDTELLNTDPSEIQEYQIHEWVNRADERKVNTRKTALSAIKSLFSWLVARGYVCENVAGGCVVTLKGLSHRQKEPRKARVFNDQEIRRLLDHTEPGSFWHTAVALGRHCGLRLSDVACLEWASFSEPGKLVVWTQKRSKRVRLPLMPEDLCRAVASIPINSSTHCFPDECSMIRGSKRSQLSQQFTRLCKRLGIDGKSFHGLRHTYATLAHKEGKTLKHISQSLGHSWLSTTGGYIDDEED